MAFIYRFFFRPPPAPVNSLPVGFDPQTDNLDEVNLDEAEFPEPDLEQQVHFSDLDRIFVPNTDAVQMSERGLVAFRVVSCMQQQSLFCKYFYMNGVVIRADGHSFFEEGYNAVIAEFEGQRRVGDMRIRPITNEERQVLRRRGRIFRRLAQGPQFVQYEGCLIRPSGQFLSRTTATGRVMLDTATHELVEPNFPRARNNQYYNGVGNGGDGAGFIFGDENKLHLCWPTLAGFSFARKKWGEFCVENVSDVTWREAALDMLVLDKEHKLMLQALVQHHADGYTDMIENKGGGVILLLHGPPGSGKTLTAEAIAEHLHRPLYVLSMGEMGTSPQHLEATLQTVLEVTSRWDAVLLIDEADVFLEARRDSSILRNAMVGVFLRLLEYHSGVMFLTTNRVRCLDDAFKSRISLAINYTSLDGDRRLQVWKNLLNAAGFPELSRDEALRAIADEHELNGRQIKSMVRLSMVLASSEGDQMTRQHIERTLATSANFVRELEDQMLQDLVADHATAQLVDAEIAKYDMAHHKQDLVRNMSDPSSAADVEGTFSAAESKSSGAPSDVLASTNSWVIGSTPSGSSATNSNGRARLPIAAASAGAVRASALPASARLRPSGTGAVTLGDHEEDNLDAKLVEEDNAAQANFLNDLNAPANY